MEKSKFKLFFENYSHILFRILVVIIYFLLFEVFGYYISLLIKNGVGETMDAISTVSILINLLIYSVLFVITCLFESDIYVVDFKILKTKKFTKIIEEVLIGTALLYAASIFGSLISMLLNGGLNSSANEQSVDSGILGFCGGFYLPIVIIIGPIVEEMIYRGAIQGTIIGSKSANTPKWRVVLGIAISSILFGLIHVIDAGDFTNIFPYLFMGIVLGSICYKTRSIWISSIVHIINNTISVLLTLLLGSLGELGLESFISFIRFLIGR